MEPLRKDESENEHDANPEGCGVSVGAHHTGNGSDWERAVTVGHAFILKKLAGCGL